MEDLIESHTRKITKETKKTLKFFKELPDDVWGMQLYTDGALWTVHQVLAHIVETEGSLKALFSNIANGGKGVGADFDIDRYNHSHVDKMSEKSKEELFSMFGERRSKMLEFVSGLSAESLENVGNHPFLGHTTLDQMLRLYLVHINIHIRDIRKALGERS